MKIAALNPAWASETTDGKNDPFRNLGIPTCRSPVAVDSTRDRVPFRSLLRVSVRS